MPTFTALTYNTHLFGEFTGIPGTHWQDETARYPALSKLLTDPTFCNADIIGIQEMWSSKFVEDIASKFPNSHYNLESPRIPVPTMGGITLPLPSALPSNPSGLVLLGSRRVQFDAKNAQYYDYVYELIKDDIEHLHDKIFDPGQDMITGKGFLKVPVTLDGTQKITVLVTHMPTSSGKYTDSIDFCFKRLADSVKDDEGPVLLLADFNVSETDTLLDDGRDRYSMWIGPNPDPSRTAPDVPTLERVGLGDAFRRLYPKQTDNPGYSVVGTTNSCWRHFNGDKISKNPPEYDIYRIDHMMCRGMTPQSMSVLGAAPPSGAPNYDDTGNQWIWLDHGTERRDLSDHYPVIGVFSL